MRMKTSSPKQTYALGEALANKIKKGIVLCLEGDLGAGKTLFVQGIAAGLHVQEEVTSPTFAIMNQYHGDCAIRHFDLYRLESAEELEDIGFDECVGAQDDVVVIEWPDKFPEAMPKERLWIQIVRGAAQEDRIFTFAHRGERARAVCEELKTTCQF